jgi:hypothetical protein
MQHREVDARNHHFTRANGAVRVRPQDFLGERVAHDDSSRERNDSKKTAPLVILTPPGSQLGTGALALRRLAVRHALCY